MNEILLAWRVWLEIKWHFACQSWEKFWRGAPPQWTLPPKPRPAELSAAAAVQRRQAAQHILTHPLFIEACYAVDERLAAARKAVPITNRDASHNLVVAEQMWGRFRSYFVQIIATGDMVEAENRKVGARQDKIAQAFKKGIRQ